MRALVLGGARFHGYELARLLAGSGTDVVVLNRGRFRSEYAFPVTRIAVDRQDREAFKQRLKNERFDVVFDNNAYRPADIEGVSDLIARSGHYVFTSSTAIYMRHSSAEPLREDSARGEADSLFDPKILPYARGKWEAEEAIRRLGASNFTIVRFPNIFGEGDFAGKLLYFSERVADGGPIFLESEVRKMSSLHVLDAAQCLCSLAGQRKSFGRTLNSPSVDDDYHSFFGALFGPKVHERLAFVPTEALRANGYDLPFAWSPPMDGKSWESLTTFRPRPSPAWLESSLASERTSLGHLLENIRGKRKAEIERLGFLAHDAG